MITLTDFLSFSLFQIFFPHLFWLASLLFALYYLIHRK